MGQHNSNRAKRLQQLSRLGVQRGAKHIASPTTRAKTVPRLWLHSSDDQQSPSPIEVAVPGIAVENDHGHYYRVDTHYALHKKHGNHPLSALLHISSTIIAAITNDEAWLHLSWQDVLFIDLETTGLDLGAGTVAFLIGVGYLYEDYFVVRQFFMRDFEEEIALLHDLYELCKRFQAVVSFNGKTFDFQILENRFSLVRSFPELLDGPHLDLLHPARRVWRRRLKNCRLITLEADLLGIARTQVDVPGHAIPAIYRTYLVDQNACPLAGIFYHNKIDIVTMAALTVQISHHFSLLDDLNSAHLFHPSDIVSVGLWRQHLGDTETAEKLLRLALNQSLAEELRISANTSLAYLLKRQHRYSEAEPIWQELVLGPTPLLALEELAKYYEWQQQDYDSALTCIAYALEKIPTETTPRRQQDTQAAWEHRRDRVRHKAKLNLSLKDEASLNS